MPLKIYFQLKALVKDFAFGLESFFLVYKTQILIDNKKSVDEYNIKNNSDLELNKIKIFV